MSLQCHIVPGQSLGLYGVCTLRAAVIDLLVSCFGSPSHQTQRNLGKCETHFVSRVHINQQAGDGARCYLPKNTLQDEANSTQFKWVVYEFEHWFTICKCTYLCMSLYHVWMCVCVYATKWFPFINADGLLAGKPTSINQPWLSYHVMIISHWWTWLIDHYSCNHYSWNQFLFS